MQCDNSRANEWGKANLMRIIKKKMSKAKHKKKGSLGGQTTKPLLLALHKTLNVHNVTLKAS
jgi:hypothetical protein